MSQSSQPQRLASVPTRRLPGGGGGSENHIPRRHHRLTTPVCRSSLGPMQREQLHTPRSALRRIDTPTTSLLQDATPAVSPAGSAYSDSLDPQSHRSLAEQLRCPPPLPPSDRHTAESPATLISLWSHSAVWVWWQGGKVEQNEAAGCLHATHLKAASPPPAPSVQQDSWVKCVDGLYLPYRRQLLQQRDPHIVLQAGKARTHP